jgi:LmeA-like phospholipid-binding
MWNDVAGPPPHPIFIHHGRPARAMIGYEGKPTLSLNWPWGSRIVGGMGAMVSMRVSKGSVLWAAGLAAAVLGVDRVTAWQAERLIERRTGRLLGDGVRAAVTRPFLTQLLARRLDQVVIDAAAVRLPGRDIQLRGLRLELRQVQVRSVGKLIAGDARLEALVPWQVIERQARLPAASLSPLPDGLIRIDRSVTIDGTVQPSAAVAELRLEDGVLSLELVCATVGGDSITVSPQARARLARLMRFQVSSFQLFGDDLSAGIGLRDMAVRADGLYVSLSGTQVNLRMRQVAQHLG